MAKQKWETILLQVDKLIAGSNGSLFDRSVLLKQIWDSPDFLAFHGANVDKAQEHLDTKLGDYGITFFDCLALLHEFPNRQQWESGKIREMLAVALEREKAERKAVEQPKVRHNPIPHKEFEKVQAQVKSLGERAESLHEENSRLRAENAELRRQLDKANGQIEELQRILDRDLVNA